MSRNLLCRNKKLVTIDRQSDTNLNIVVKYLKFSFLVILDSNGADCQEAVFNISPDTTTTRAWTVRVTQYNCGQEDSAGPPGCLQYYTTTSNTIEK